MQVKTVSQQDYHAAAHAASSALNGLTVGALTALRTALLGQLRDPDPDYGGICSVAYWAAYWSGGCEPSVAERAMQYALSHWPWAGGDWDLYPIPSGDPHVTAKLAYHGAVGRGTLWTTATPYGRNRLAAAAFVVLAIDLRLHSPQ